MSTLKLSPEFLQQIHELALHWGKTAATVTTIPSLPIVRSTGMPSRD